ncbi:WD40/YVTN/BNR-like repeat-containing protein [Lapillicoccus jejuensis]|uniref:Glycosyl hydrolase n=1 Tax=Lapillicoccus jejuensis TaxID=402171 RepID=A0A542DYD2_9MICO|nr:glycosyl hydrolase [Lapillicoccus jejuensis]TQJ08097.1 hypothetical protein FB458_1179 [Lapillicoccus jejuensis]
MPHAVLRRRRTTAGALGAALAVVVVAAGPVAASGSAPGALTGAAATQAQRHAALTHPSAARTAQAAAAADDGGGRDVGDALEVADRADEFANERSAPAVSAPAAALLAAQAHAAGMPASSAGLKEITGAPYDANPPGYTDPTWSNAGSGFGVVAGRTTALATDGTTIYAGAADGGVWRSKDEGATWTPIWDGQPSQSIGALYVDAGHHLWVGTGEANTNSDSYLGVGVYWSADQGATFTRVGGTELQNAQVYRLRDAGDGWVYAATSNGLWRHRSDRTGGQWQSVLKPDPNPTGSPYLTSQITDVVVRPGTNGQDVTAVLGWRNGSSYNGFYRSTTGGGAGSFKKFTPAGAIDATDIGRTTLQYAADGSRLYAIVQSPKALLAGGATNLQGVFVSPSGAPTGPWQLVADSAKLGASGSALMNMPGYHVGIQSWYNQALQVDPSDPMHVYVSLEEVFQTRNGGTTFTTASPYWNYGLACGDSCPRTTHPDQHALAVTGDGQIVIGNDGGVYRRPLSVTGYGRWSDLNDGLRTLQFYDAKSGAGAAGGNVGYWGGLQDNGTALVQPSGRTVEPAGGDGGAVLVDPSSYQRMVGEYTNLQMYRSSDGGHSFTTLSPVCGVYTGADCDPTARFIAPIAMDVHDSNHWVVGGSAIWDTTKGWATSCAGATCDFTQVHSLGKDAAGGDNLASAIAVSGVTTYAGWVGGGGNPGPAFASGIDTNYGGSWHRISSPVLPNRFVTGLTVDPANPAHVYATFSGYSRRWIPGGGVGGVFESTDGGSTWRNISGNLPDAPADALAVVKGTLVLGTDLGAFTASQSSPMRWSRVAGLPTVVVNNVSLSADGRSAVLGTHGRGIWTVTPARS